MHSPIRYFFKLILFRHFWRKRNKHNGTTAETVFPINCVQVGLKTYGPLVVHWMYSGKAELFIGNYCSIGPGVEFLVGGVHDYRRISTWPFQSKIYKQKNVIEDNMNIIVEDDVWIGMETLVMSGVRIGRGSVVGARSIVTKDIPPYSIYIGNKIVKRRFSDEVIEKIKCIDFSQIFHQKGDRYEKNCQTIIDEENVEQIMRDFLVKGNEINE